jgi:glycosyltransferase involved in cell wall biosynthesis
VLPLNCWSPLGSGQYRSVSHWEEIFCWTITEAMACGKPVVATRVGGIPELVQDGETGFLVPRGDVAAVAARILTLLGDVELRQRMGRAARQIAETKFNLKRNVAKLLEFYRPRASSSGHPRDDMLGSH